eukprot:SAG31_NODE_2406_length_5762_cov_6.711107_5_plen_44_part_00
MSVPGEISRTKDVKFAHAFGKQYGSAEPSGHGGHSESPPQPSS